MSEANFLSAITNNPQDETCRLVFADWLDDHGDARGEFIRHQCYLTHLTSGAPERLAVSQRVNALLATHELEWVRPIKDFILSWRFRSGFVEDVTLTMESFLRYGDTLFSSAPIRNVHLTRVREPLGNLLASPSLSQLDCLNLNFNNCHDEGAEGLAHCPLLHSLRSLKIGGNPITQRGRAILEQRFHSSVVFDCRRDPDYLYTFRTDTGSWQTGVTSDGSQHLLLLADQEIIAIVFDLEGHLIRFETRTLPTPPPPSPWRVAWYSNLNQLLQLWEADLNLVQSPIRALGFSLPELSLRIEDPPLSVIPFPLDEFSFAPPDELENFLDYYWGTWEPEGLFAFNFGDVLLINKQGRVVAS